MPNNPNPLRRIGALGDVHCEDEALERALGFLASERVEPIVCVGDIADGPGDLERCCELLIRHGVEAVRGNHDRWALAGQLRDLPDASPTLSGDARAYLGTLPATREYSVVGGSLLLCHGLGTDDMNGIKPDDFGYVLDCNEPLQELMATGEHRFVINGHTHQRMVRSFGPVTILNVGTLLRGQEPCFAVVDFEQRDVAFYDLAPDGPALLAGRHGI